MYKRLLDKNNPPSIDFVKEYMSIESYNILMQFEDLLSNNYELFKELKFPFGNNYGWGYKYSHKSNHLCYVFFESGAFTVTLQLGDNCVSKIEQILPNLSDKAKELWENRYPCGRQGGWIHYRVIDVNDLENVIEFVKIKKKPAIK